MKETTTMFFAMNLAHEYNVLEKKHDPKFCNTKEDRKSRKIQLGIIEDIEKNMKNHLNKKYGK